MKALEIQLYGLIGLRALAEYDPPEYSRAVDLSRRELERKIESGLKAVENADLKQLYQDMKLIIDSTENQIEMSYLLQQIYTSSSIRAHFFSMQHHQARFSDTSIELPAQYSDGNYQEPKGTVLSSEDELIRLSAMSLLREIRGYIPKFNVRLKNFEVDCIMEPESPDLPHMVIEVKSHFHKVIQSKSVIKRLKSVMSVFGRKTIGVLIVERRLLDLNDQMEGYGVHVLVFDVRKNRFVGQGLENLISQVISSN